MLVLLASLLALPVRADGPGVAVPIEDPGHVGLSHWFSSLAAAERGGATARALHYGDSTLAADDLARTVRDRLTARFGDGGPGFVPASFLPMWSVRSDVAYARHGEWRWRTILYGGAGGRYGLGGVVGIVDAGGSVVLRATDAAGQTRPQQHLEVWYQAGVGYGAVKVEIDGETAARESAAALATEDRRLVVDRPGGFERVKVGATGGTVPFYGVVLESGLPGATWETLAVSGVGSKSFTIFAGDGLAPQVAQRRPDLVAVMLGGNEASYPILTVGRGEGYAPIFAGALDLVLAGAPEASCLVISPLDQGETTEDGVRRGKPGMANLVARQREVALARGCAFWSAWDAMGGEGASVAWTRHRGLTSGDLVHLSSRGLAIVGDLLADALLADYAAWVGQGGPATTAAGPE